MAMGPVTTAVGTEQPRSGWRAADLRDGEGGPVLAGMDGQAGLLQEWSGERMREMMDACEQAQEEGKMEDGVNCKGAARARGKRVTLGWRG